MDSRAEVVRLAGISLYKALAFKVQDYLRIFRVSGLKPRRFGGLGFGLGVFAT